MREFLLDILKVRLTREQWAWLENALPSPTGRGRGEGSANDGSSKSAVMANYTQASRRLGKFALQLAESERIQLRKLDPLLTIDHWGADEAARAAMLLSIAHLPENDYSQLVLACYELGDSREQQSWLRALSVLPCGELFVHTAIDSCRTNIIPLFEAIACENPYPSIHFPDLNFNQMIMKCLFNRIALSRIAGLESRFNTELSRMADQYRNERELAGRDLPPDIWVAINGMSKGAPK